MQALLCRKGGRILPSNKILSNPSKCLHYQRKPPLNPLEPIQSDNVFFEVEINSKCNSIFIGICDLSKQQLNFKSV